MYKDYVDSKKVIRTERGWPGHFICADQCLFRRNTLLEYDPVKIVVSTVGNLVVQRDGKTRVDTIGCGRYYETMAFHVWDNRFHDIDVEKQVEVGCQWQLNELDDLKANDMHENAVAWVTEQLLENRFLEQYVADKPYKNMCAYCPAFQYNQKYN